MPTLQTMHGPTFMQWGLIRFQTYPLNIHEYDHSTGATYAKKEVMELIPHREWTGHDDETLRLVGRIFPYRIGGFSSLEAFDRYREQGNALSLMRGNISGGHPMGWYVCEQFTRRHSMLSIEGIGRQINFEATMARVDIPEASGHYTVLYGVMS